MNRTEAISLFRSSGLPLGEARVREPDVAKVVDRAATAERVTTLELLRASLPPAAVDVLRDIDVRTLVGGTLGSVLRDRVATLTLRPGAPSPARPTPAPRPTPTTPQPAAPSAAELDALRDAATRLADVEDPLPSDDTKLQDIPLLRPGIDLGRFYVLADAVKLSSQRAEALAKTLPSPEAATDEVLADLVEKQTLKPDEARSLGAARVAFLLSDDTEALTRAVAGKQVTDLIAMRPDAWEKALKATNAPIPDDYDASSWAGELARRHAALAPSRALYGRLLGALDDDAVQVERIVAAWPSFNLDAVLADPGLTPTQRRSMLKTGLAAVTKLQKAHTEVDWLTLDYTRGSADLHALKLDADFTSAEQSMLLESLKAQQRVHAITVDVDTSIRLLEGGYHAAPTIALARVPKLIADTGLAREEAERVRFSATEMLGITVNMAFGIHDLVRGPFGKQPFGNLRSGAQDYLAKIEGYAEFFGSQAWCDCKHCNSILSPAAYFVDLMGFVDEHIREPLFTTQRPGHVLDLKVRRPDLWKLPLTCENTNTLVPTLDIINEILENFVATRTGFGGALADRALVGTHVYRQALYEAVEIRAFDHPFCLPYDRVTRLLSQVGRTRADVAAVLGGSQTAKRLALSARGRSITFTVDTDRMRLSRLFDITIPASGVVATVDVPDFLRTTGLSRDELGELIASWFVRGSDAPRIQAGKSSAASVQNDVERLHGLNTGVLDRMHRFVRLAHAADLAFPELDLWMRERGLSNLNALAGEEVARLLTVRAVLGVDLEDTLGLCGTLPTHAVKADGKSLFDQRFNSPSYLGLGGELPLPGRAFIHSASRAAGTAADPLTPRLCAGVGVSEEDLSRLILALRLPLGVTNNADGFVLTADTLSLLYRHARLAAAFKVRIDQLFQLLAFVDGLANPWVGGIDGLEHVLDFVVTWREGKRTLDALGVITDGPVLDPAAWLTLADIVAHVRAEPADAFRFADTVFATALGLPEAASRRIVSDNAARFEAADGRWQLRSDFSFATALAVPGGVDEPAVRDVLRNYHASAVLPVRLARALKIDSAKAAGLLSVAGMSRDAPDAGLVAAVRGDGTPDALEALLAVVLPLRALFSPPEIDTEALNFIAENRAMFGLDAMPTIPVGAVWAIDRYARLTRGPSVAFGESETTLSRADFHALLLTHTSTGFPANQDAILARALRADVSLASTVRTSVPAATTAIDTLHRLARAVNLARGLGMSGDTLPLLLSDDYDALAQAADALVAGFRLRYPDETTANAQLEPVEDATRGRKRDALCSYLLRSLAPAADIPWRNRSDLYHYFLLDVDMGGCGRTSRIVSAISSLQLYVHRVRMNLEQDQRQDGDPQKLRVQLPSEAAEEWTWRQNYRVWEANRKVFLWPENYLEPDLRDDKTDQFVELESTLLQQEINEQTVLDAYTHYLAGFEEVAKLRIGGAWYEATSSVDRLHLFGATSSDPSVWHYRHVDNLRFARWNQSDGVKWGNWVKLNVQIPVREVAPVVFEGRLHVFWVEIRTKSVNDVKDGNSTFVGYDHAMRLKFTTLRTDGTWTVPQEVSLAGWPYSGTAGGIRDHFKFVASHSEPCEDYTLIGPTWDRVIPDVSDGLYIHGRNHRFQARIDIFGRRLVAGSAKSAPPKATTGDLANIPAVLVNRDLYVGTVSERLGLCNAAAAILLDERWTRGADGEKTPDDDWISRAGLYSQKVGRVHETTDLHAVPRSSGSREDAIMQFAHDPVLFHGSAEQGASARVLRLGTTLANSVARRLFERGVDAILARDFQTSLNEGELPVTVTSSLVKTDPIETGVDGAKAVLRGPLGAWYQEIFLHIPWRIALHLNAQGRYEAAQRWFHYIFDPTASDASGSDRVWRYAGFRELSIPTLRSILTDEAAIEAYKDDPFNPHAIARLRPSAYQKHMVMRYVDNLLDWADSLFTQFTTESLNEAVLLYVLAGDILGERPARLGDCGEGVPTPRDYEHIKPLLDKGSEFLIELQTWSFSKVKAAKASSAIRTFGADVASLSTAKDPARKMGKRGAAFRGPGSSTIQTGAWKNPDLRDDKGTGARFGSKERIASDRDHKWFGEASGRFGWTLVRQLSPVFYAPPNKELLAYWDRVEDRLGKIRSCRDINGISRMPLLFAPEIDPRLLVRARALGLSLDEVLGGTGGSLPPYRFLYLIEKAKAMAATVASFGSALLSALEKKDVEQLNRLRLVQQQNIAKLTTNLRRWEVEVAEEALTAVDRQIEAATYRKEYYAGLEAEGRTGYEITQSTSVHTASISRGLAAVLGGTAGILTLIPQLGSPLCMKYGGVELGGSMERWATVARDTAGIADLVASSAGLEAGFERRADGWNHQKKLADHDLKQLKHQREITALRFDIATRALEIHEESVAQIEEMFAFYDGKFTGLGLYTWLTTTLQRVYRGAYNNALALARLADEAFRYERGTSDFLIETSYWDASHAGLGAGEQLLLALQSLERRFIETNYRNHEVDQAFSLQQLAPAAIVKLRETGTCDFDIPELFFDLAYPGHYRRRIKAVRLTIPCVTGPYVNIGAMLSLSQSYIRSEASGDLVDFPVRRSVSVATSTAQNDAGVFELSFRDERYMPFEGAGAVSRWKLELPSTFRAFDYGSINDVILSISYTAEYDGTLRGSVQQVSGALERSLLNVLRSKPVARLFSLKSDFAAAFNRVLHSGAGTAVTFEIGDPQLPFFLVGRTLVIEKAILGVELTEGADPTGLSLSVDGGAALALAAQPDLAGMLGAVLPAAFRTNFRTEHSITVLDGGNLRPASPLPGDPSPLDDARVKDVVIYLEIKVA